MTTETTPPETREAIKQMLDEFDELGCWVKLNYYDWIREELGVVPEVKPIHEEPPF